MKKLFIIFLSLISITGYSQVDSLTSVVYFYEMVGTKHYYVSTKIASDSTLTITKMPFTTRKQVFDFVKTQIDTANAVAHKISETISQKQDYLRNINDRVKQFNESITNEIEKIKDELIGLRTERKIVIESKDKLKTIN
jgi:gas vesicle protein